MQTSGMGQVAWKTAQGVFLALWWLTRRPVLALATLSSSALTLSPWVVYSVSTFGVPFATDNSWVAMALDRSAFVTDWWPAPQPTAADAPLALLSRILDNAWRFGGAILRVVSSDMALVFPSASAILLGVQSRLGAAITSQHPTGLRCMICALLRCLSRLPLRYCLLRS